MVSQQKNRRPRLTVEAAGEVRVMVKRDTDACLGSHQVDNKESCDGKGCEKKYCNHHARVARPVSQTHPRPLCTMFLRLRLTTLSAYVAGALGGFEHY